MSFEFAVTIDAAGGHDKNAIVASATLTVPAANEVKLHIADGVDVHRRVEILEGWKWLYSGVRDRALLDVQFKDQPLATGVPVDDISIPARKTASDPALVAADGDILLSLGLGVTNEGATRKVESAVDSLRDFAKELQVWA